MFKKQGSELYSTHIPKLLSLRKHQIKGVRSCTNTHIPKQNHCTISQRIWFGSVQHAYTKTFRLINSPSTLVRSRAKNTYTKTLDETTIYRILGSALCKYCIYQNVILDNISHHIGSGLWKTHIPKRYKHFRWYDYWFGAVPKTHIPKLRYFSNSVKAWFGAIQIIHISKKHLYTCGKAIGFGVVHKCIYQNKCSSCNKWINGSELCKYAYTKTSSLYLRKGYRVRSCA